MPKRNSIAALVKAIRKSASETSRSEQYERMVRTGIINHEGGRRDWSASSASPAQSETARRIISD